MRRGTLRIYLGAAPGVGKTVAMLGEGHRRAERGADVVVGFVETHDRAYTARAASGLETIPRRVTTYRGVEFTELDTDAVLARSPQVVLVDELAHSNVPGSARRRRYEDIEVLLAAGIDVVSTVNIQHLESLNDAVFAITGVRQRETVPDGVVRGADQIELVDMSPESLRRRMAHGNVYKAEKVDAALASYFRPGNLAALRELALLWLADRVDERLESYRADHEIRSSWPARERVVVAVTAGPEGESVLRRGARIASRGAGGELTAVYVRRSDGLIGSETSTVTARHTLTQELGGQFHTVAGDDIAEAILAFARRVNASQIVLGASSRSRWARLFSEGVGDQVVAGSGDIDVHLVTHARVAAGGGAGRRSRVGLGRARVRLGWASALAGPAALTGILVAAQGYHQLPLDVMLYLAVAVGVALLGGLGPALLCSVLGALMLNWFFTPPLHTFTVAEPVNMILLVVYLLVSAAVASVVHHSARRAAEAAAAQREAAGLTRVTHAMLSSTEPLPLLLQECLDIFGMTSGAVVRTPAGPSVEETGRPRLLAAVGGFTVDDVTGASVREQIDDETTLVLSGRELRAQDQSLVTAYAANAAAVLTRQRLRAEEAAASSLAQDNRARQALLSAVSHDLRTPLAAVKAAVSSLRSDEVVFSDEDEAELLAAIEESTDRLDALVGNLLDLSRLETGAMRPHRVVFDVVAAVRATTQESSTPERVSLWEQGECLAYADPGLLDRVVANLVENALRHAPRDSQVVVNVARVGGRTQVRVIDNGPGVPRSEYDRIFQPFRRQGDVPAGDGVGLGLAVARGLAESMDASVTADDTPGGGLTMTVDLPGEPLRVGPEPEGTGPAAGSADVPGEDVPAGAPGRTPR
ncbi:sensor histidine kinase [Austwickia chelonae]|uniref:histidine kinase n=1 Tax=Austwickia chelonae NBRC 105200 TaxID=1184607 RepID=K6VR32_9MICO|nr:ATP-binding protein [Austwickia chelonae]GAB79209.1 two-component histidine kinase KdpD [Austwickia chelonae NBRC 105200]